MIIQDKLVKELNDAKNAVEEYVYDLRDKLCGIYEKFVNEDVSAPQALPLAPHDYVDVDIAFSNKYPLCLQLYFTGQ